MQEIKTLRSRVRELESLLNQPHSQTESPRERQFQVESINPCFEQQEGGRRVGFTEDVSSTGEEPTNDEVEPTTQEVTPAGEVETCTDS